MLIRVLVAVLTLLGPMPLRVCTCAASTAPVEQVTPTQPVAIKTCRCHGAERADHATHAGPGAPQMGWTASAGHTHGGHAPDCPAVSPRPVVRDALAVLLPFDLTHADAGLPIAALGSTSPTPNREGVALWAVTPGTPLYLSLLVLRL